MEWVNLLSNLMNLNIINVLRTVLHKKEKNGIVFFFFQLLKGRFVCFTKLIDTIFSYSHLFWCGVTFSQKQ